MISIKSMKLPFCTLNDYYNGKHCSLATCKSQIITDFGNLCQYNEIEELDCRFLDVAIAENVKSEVNNEQTCSK